MDRNRTRWTVEVGVVRWAMVILLLCCGGCAGPRRSLPTKEYQIRQVQGWKVYLSPAAIAEDEYLDGTIELLQLKLTELEKLLPTNKLNQLRAFPIWIEHNSSYFDAAIVTHVSKGWLLMHGFNPDKAIGLEICHTDKFIKRTFEEEPMVLLRQLASAYLHGVIGRNDEGVINAFSSAVNSGKYNRVRTLRGQMSRAFAIQDPSTYFSELTEAFFGTNDFYPFTRSDLKEFDSLGYALMERVWLSGE